MKDKNSSVWERQLTRVIRYVTRIHGNRTKAPPPRQKLPGQKSPHNEIIIQSDHIFFYIDGDIKDILKIKTHTY